ncbi:META domain-containing protein [Ancylobacter terrae]|uniref:META domain-containing protein n=1 Tax=Ancylobacter sp. sgz301288 TaxID=3342077 RepID=UPI00385B3448
MLAAMWTAAALPAVATEAAPTGKWLAEDLRGRGVIDNAQTTLEFLPDGQVAGSGGCNRYRTAAAIEGDTVRFDIVAGTRMMCPPALMTQEQTFYEVLAAARRWSVIDGKLRLLNQLGATLAVFGTAN